MLRKLATPLRVPLRHAIAPNSARLYAISRFPPKSGPGASRSRRSSPREPPQPHAAAKAQDSYQLEDKPSLEESPLWDESQRLPVSNPEEGLKNLLLPNDTLLVTRQLEMLNIFIGFEQTNKYVISNENGDTMGFIAEEPRGFLQAFGRQIFRTHRPFRAIVMDSHGTPILWIRRPFDWINSRMYVQRIKDLHEYTPEGEPVLDTFAEVQQRWHLWRRRYDLFLRETSRRILSTLDEPQPEPDTEHFSQFARTDEGLWAWHFTMRGRSGEEIASVNRAFRGFGREIFTDTGKFFWPKLPEATPPNPDDATPSKPTVIRNLTLEERALVLAMAVNIDFDYFSRHSEGGHGIGLPFFGFGSEE
ncbi:Scramblase-domain-containing protein [Auriscalpium vulgare]|uniref:Scramblase-domain-containing protein n=1 Tax=Auriscalpium vulgare TaxID=40419 RepID=A0ACB8S334_9AGAM|nr:Scramblase-domain-containing protein [Auriscalpium vulgare]